MAVGLAFGAETDPGVRVLIEEAYALADGASGAGLRPARSIEERSN